MRRSAGISLTACALSASAFLLPPGFTVATDKQRDSLSLLGVPRPAGHVLRLPCSECAFSTPKGDIREEAEDAVYHIQGGANEVVLNFSVSEDGRSLELGGRTIYPSQMGAEHFHKAYVKQVPSSASLEDIETGDVKYPSLEVTEFGTAIYAEEVVTSEGDVLIPIKHTVFEIEGQPVSIDEVSLSLLQTPTGDLTILNIDTSERRPPPPHRMGHPHRPHHHTECKVLPPALCRLRHMLEAKLTGTKHGGGMRKPCPGRKGKGGPGHHMMGPMGPGHHNRPHFDEFDKPEGPPSFPYGRPHHYRPHHGGHHHRHHHGGFFHSFSRGFAAVLIPTLAGIAVGMMVSLFGLVIGRIIGFLWIKLVRGGRHEYASVALDEQSFEATGVDDDFLYEKQGEDLQASDLPPAYTNDVATSEKK